MHHIDVPVPQGEDPLLRVEPLLQAQKASLLLGCGAGGGLAGGPAWVGRGAGTPMVCAPPTSGDSLVAFSCQSRVSAAQRSSIACAHHINGAAMFSAIQLSIWAIEDNPHT